MGLKLTFPQENDYCLNISVIIKGVQVWCCFFNYPPLTELVGHNGIIYYKSHNKQDNVLLKVNNAVILRFITLKLILDLKPYTQISISIKILANRPFGVFQRTIFSQKSHRTINSCNFIYGVRYRITNKDYIFGIHVRHPTRSLEPTRYRTT